ncbi:uncharacterized protein LOC112564442 [Pomacea canaliculata]|uniref:uncharacterized protein LOC112564442 n=1 Tax=Pomacea canaliculata TaxID=400727 RepID=UPI000D72F943|nr:uncharacterized protein LOC112564442 [Pomacea canaliculata]
MERSTWVVFGGLAIFLAVFLQLTVLQGSRAQVEVYPRSTRAGGCPPFQAPYTSVGRYHCIKKRASTLYNCKLNCPANMRPEPQRQQLTYKCTGGRWVSSHDDRTQCVARRSVNLVEQRLASPALLNQLLELYLNHSYTYFAMAYFCDRADVQLPGFQKFFLGMWQASTDMTRDLLSYINKRGGWFSLRMCTGHKWLRSFILD